MMQITPINENHTPEELLQHLPALLAELGFIQMHDNDAIISAVNESNLSPAPHMRKPWTELQKYPTLRFESGELLDDTFERKLRSLITRELGKPASTAKTWNVGSYEIDINVRPTKVLVHLHPHYSIQQLRGAAADFLQGADIEVWLATHDFPDTAYPGKPSVHRLPSSRVSINLFMAAAVKPLGTKPASDDENLHNTYLFLEELLGVADTPGRWVNGSRVFEFKRMRSRSRSITFTSEPANIKFDGDT